MAHTKKELFTIAQAANACNVSRSTLLRMEEEGLLTPALHEDGKYRYYCKSVPLPEEMRDKDIRTTYPKGSFTDGKLVRRGKKSFMKVKA